MINDARMERKVINQQLQQRRSCWCICSSRTAELHVQRGDTLHSAETYMKIYMLNVSGRYGAGYSGTERLSGQVTV